MDEGYNETMGEQMPMPVPYAPQYAMQYPVPYRVPGYTIPPMQEPVPLEAMSLTPMGYPEHATHYIDSPYAMPYTVYQHPQYYYQN